MAKHAHEDANRRFLVDGAVTERLLAESYGFSTFEDAEAAVDRLLADGQVTVADILSLMDDAIAYGREHPDREEPTDD